MIRSSSRIRALSESNWAMIFRSCRMSLVPMVSVPLNIMCSKRWEIPVMPVISLAEPTRAKIAPMMVGASCLSTIRTCMPLSSQYSLASMFWAATGMAAASTNAAQTRTAHTMHLFMNHSFSDVEFNRPILRDRVMCRDNLSEHQSQVHRVRFSTPGLHPASLVWGVETA